MKAGDLVLCKKEYGVFVDLSFEPGKYYKILSIDFIKYDPARFYKVTKDEYVDCDWITIDISTTYRQFSTVKIGEYNYFDEHFYTPKEIREMKLKQLIYESR